MKEINLKFENSFVHMRTNGEIYKIVVNDNIPNFVALELSSQDFQALYNGMIKLENAIKK